MKIEYYTKNNFSTSSWQGGKTTELLILPKEANYKERNFIARLSSATIETSSSEFTTLHNIKRFITPITAPFLLESNIKETFLLKPFEVYEFSGDERTFSYGMSQDFNLMVDTQKADGWMKTSKDKKEVIIDIKNSKILFFFSSSSLSIDLETKDYSKKMEAYSLLTIKDIPEKTLKVKLSKASPVIFGGIKY